MQATTATSTPVKLFLTGATGYIGGTVLAKLLHPSQTGKWDITALTRSENTLAKFRELGVTPLLGSLDDSQLLTKAASEADVVINMADNDSMVAIKALRDGLSSAGKRRILIHTSGTGELSDESKGEFTSDFIYSDLDIETIHNIPLPQPHRDVDKFIFENNQGFESVIICPPTIYGIGTGPFKRHSVQIPLLIRAFIKYGYAATVGKGLNIWNNVHVEDLADFYLLVLEKSLKGEVSIGRDGWYFCESGEHYLKDVVAKIGEELHKHGAIKQAETVQFKTEEVKEYLGPYGFDGIGGNSRSSAERARQLGWKASGTQGGILDSLAAEVEAIVAEQKSH